MQHEPIEVPFSASPAEKEEQIRTALQKRRCVTASYNQGEVLLAPYLLYQRHDQLHLAAVTLRRDGRRPAAEKVAIYRLSGLDKIKVTNALFTAKADLLADMSHPVDLLLASVLRK